MSQAIQTAIRARGGFCFKVHGGPHTMSGVPDIVAVVLGYSIWIETKMPGNKPSEIQKHRHRQIVAAGGHVIVPHSVTEAMDAIAAIVAPNPW